MSRALVLLLALALAGCGTSQPIPDFRYYRLPPAEVAPRPQPAVAQPIVVDNFLADGLHGEQAVLYALREDGPVKAYHYQLWNDPPGALLQRRLIRRLRDAKFSAGLVADRLPSTLDAIRITGLIERFERLQVGEERWEAVVRIELRVQRGDRDVPLLIETYEARKPAETATMQSTVRAFAAAIDEVFARFAGDLEGALR